MELLVVGARASLKPRDPEEDLGNLAENIHLHC